jgi:putative Holliday junction resolvase
MTGRILAVDPGEARIGLALSDPSGTVARPHAVLKHRSRAADAQTIARLAQEQEVGLILVGLPSDAEGRVGPQARRALRLVEALRMATRLPVETWDETGSTQAAIDLGGDDAGQDARAAAVILQDYLNAAGRPGCSDGAPR